MIIRIIRPQSGPGASMTDLVKAYIEGEPALTGIGRSSSEAIGDLLCNHPERFGVARVSFDDPFGAEPQATAPSTFDAAPEPQTVAQPGSSAQRAPERSAQKVRCKFCGAEAVFEDLPQEHGWITVVEAGGRLVPSFCSYDHYRQWFTKERGGIHSFQQMDTQ
jgi:hypothetical protein